MHFLFKSIVLATLILCVYACEHKRVGNRSFVVSKNSEGNLISEINYINDTVMDGLVKFYYPNSNNILEHVAEIINGKKNGYYKHYRQNATLESVTYYKNNLPEGNNTWFYENGIKKEETYWTEGKQYGVGKWYYKNGKLETFSVLNFFSKCMYVIQYDSLGNKIKEEGLVYSPNFLTTYANDTTQINLQKGIKANKEIVIKITVAQPPQTSTTIKIGELNKSNILYPIENYTVTYRRKFSKAGKYKLTIAGEIKDLQGKLLREGNSIISINVKE